LQHGQQGVSALADIPASTGDAETAAIPVAGTTAIEIATRTARIVRVKAISTEVSGNNSPYVNRQR
jgi:hypothetical protein